MAAADYGKSDIDNGGFQQFFSNHTGAYAPEIAEWFERANLLDAAEIVRQAIAVFGDRFSRSQQKRQQFLEEFHREAWQQWDLFGETDDRFYNSTVNELFKSSANKWLRNCGIENLKQRF